MVNAQPDANGLRNSLPEGGTRRSNPGLFLILIISIAWWLLTRPYQGIWHDGIFYTAQALRRLHPEAYAQDVFFLYGSQDDYSIYSSLQSWLTSFVGTEHAYLLLTLAGAALWLYALLRLLKRWLSTTQLVFAVILILSADAHYGGFDVFAYGERFASPRIFSEALVLLSLSLWFEGRRVMAGFVLAGAALIHLLIALAGMGVFIWSVMSARVLRPAVLWLVLLGLGLLGMQFLVWVGLSPELDPYWRQLVAQRSPFVFPHLWNTSDWLRLTLDISLLWLASHQVQGEAGKLAGWVLPVLALAMLWSLAAEAMAVQLAVAAQMQRVQWLAHLLALALVAPLCLGLWRSSKGWDRYLAGGVAGGLFFPLNLGGLVLPVVYGLYRWSAYRLPDKLPGRALSLLLFAAIPGAGLALWLFYFASNLILASVANERTLWLWVFIQAPVALGVFVAWHFLATRLRWGAGWLYLYGACVLAVGIFHWDLRKPWSAVYDQPERTVAIAPVQAMIPQESVVYWESGVYVATDNLSRLDRGLERAWFWLGRANYASFDQAAGNVFFRKTAEDMARRAAHLRKWGFRDGNLKWEERRRPPQKCRLSVARLQGVCTDPLLDYVITDTILPEARLSFQDLLTGRKFGVYDCRQFRQGKP